MNFRFKCDLLNSMPRRKRQKILVSAGLNDANVKEVLPAYLGLDAT